MAKTFAGMEILGKLGQGGMGAVYKARQPKLDRVVALKVMNPGVSSKEAYARFQREIKVIGKLRHANIVRLFTVGREKNRIYFTMDYIEGESLSWHMGLAETPADRDQLVRHVAAVARAIHYAHTQNIIHRDLKPSNIIMDQEGRPFITDFGLAKELGAGETLTISGEAVGTVQYMPPEQAHGELENIGPQSDVYALGAILYEILTGRPPFEGPTPAVILQKVIREKVEAPRKLNPIIPRDLETICLKCLEKEPKDRYESAGALADDIARHMAGERIAVRRAGVTRRFAVAVRFYPLATAVVGLAAALAVAAVIWGLGANVPSPTVGERKERAPVTPTDTPRPKAEQGDRHIQEVEARRKAEDEQRNREEDRRRREGAGRAVAGAARRKAALVKLVRERQRQRMQARREMALKRLGWRPQITLYYNEPRVNTVACIATTREGVWWGCPVGVVLLDPRTGNTLSFPLGVSVVSAATDSKGTCWFGTKSAGVICFDGKTWKNYTKKDGLTSNHVTAIAIDRKGRQWFGTERGDISCFDGTTWKRLTPRRGRIGWVSGIRAIAIDQGDRMWFGTKDGVYCLDGQSWHSYHHTEKGLVGGWCEGIAFDRGGRTWIGAWRGVSCFDGRKWETRTRGYVHVNDIAIDGEDRKWVATDRGVYCLDGKTWTRHTKRRVWAIAIDPEGRKWFAFCTHGTGVTCFDGKKWRNYTQQDRLANNIVNAIAIDQHGHKWFATARGVSCFDGKRWSTYTEKDGLGSDFVVAVAIDRKDRKWFGFAQTGKKKRTGVSCFDGNTWKTYSKTDGLVSNYVMAIAVDSKGAKWFGTDSGVSCFDGKTWKTYTKKDGLANDYAKTVIADLDGRLWFSSFDGVTCFDGVTWKTYTKKDGLASDQVASIAIDREGRTWLAHNRIGVSCFDGKTWKTYTKADGLATNHVDVMAIDAQGRKWFGTLGGVVCVDRGTRVGLGMSNLLVGIKRGRVINVTCLAVDLDGSIWVGTTTGVSHIVLEKRS